MKFDDNWRGGRENINSTRIEIYYYKYFCDKIQDKITRIGIRLKKKEKRKKKI